MTYSRIPGPACQVRNWFADRVEDGTLARTATPAPGTLDAVDHAIRGLNVQFWHPPLRFAPLGRQGSTEFAEFEQRVLNTHILRSELRHGHAASAGIPDSDLASVHGNFKLRTAAASKCRALLQQAHADLKAEKASGDTHAAQVRSIGLTSAYRGPEYDEALWRSYFRNKYYRLNLPSLTRRSGFVVGKARARLLTDVAARDLVEFIKDVKAAPGFSNHTNGIAVDFFTEEGGRTYAAETGTKKAALKKLNEDWAKTWFYKWLTKHKAVYGIERIPTEAWHWEFR